MNDGIRGAADVRADLELEADVCIVGSGAGGAVLAAGLAARGLSVVVLEEGSYRTSADFRVLDEAWSYPALYQERGGRATADRAITVLQGRSIGGGTTVNWTTCFRTPERILEHWARVHGVTGLGPDDLAPHFEAVEERLNIHRWQEELVNANNHTLLDGARKLGIDVAILRRNVKGCANSGYCGFGCPFDAKQAMHLTYVPDAIAAGAQVFADVRAERFEVVDGRVVAVHASVMDPDRDVEGPVRITVRSRVAVSSAGAINGPALLLRSGLDDGRVGRRTFLHPVVSVSGRYGHPIGPWYGAPQSVTSHEYIDRGDEVGFFLELAPVHPMLASVSFPVHGAEQQQIMAQLSHTSSMIALHVDGLLDGDDGGTVSVRPDGRIRLDYPVTERLRRAFRASHEVMARVHLAAGALEAVTLHNSPLRMRSEADLGALDERPYGALEHAIFSAHQMGGCAMGPDPATSVVDLELRHHGVSNLFVVDGSVLPTALGVNPSETIYGIAHWAVEGVARAATG